MHVLRPGPSTVLPEHPFADIGPRVRGGGLSDHEPEVTRPHYDCGHLGAGGGPPDSSNSRGLTDVIDLPDERKNRTSDFRERYQGAVDRGAAGHHAVVDHELS